MAKLISRNVEKTISRKILSTLRDDCRRETIEHFNQSLDSQKTASGERLPDKDESTIRQYEKKGYNTKKWMVRSGKSTELQSKNIPGGITLEPRGKEILKNVDKAQEWFTPNNELIQKIIKILKERLN